MLGLPNSNNVSSSFIACWGSWINTSFSCQPSAQWFWSHGPAVIGAGRTLSLTIYRHPSNYKRSLTDREVFIYFVMLFSMAPANSKLVSGCPSLTNILGQFSHLFQIDQSYLEPSYLMAENSLLSHPMVEVVFFPNGCNVWRYIIF